MYYIIIVILLEEFLKSFICLPVKRGETESNEGVWGGREAGGVGGWVTAFCLFSTSSTCAENFSLL